MEYNFSEIGERIRQLRKANGWSQERFIEKIDIPLARNTLSAMENGEEEKFTLSFLLAACKLFDCDLGYLMGEIPAKKIATVEISKVIGIEPAEIECLDMYAHYDKPDVRERNATLGDLIRDEYFMAALLDNINAFCRKYAAHMDVDRNLSSTWHQKNIEKDRNKRSQLKNEVEMLKHDLTQRIDTEVAARTRLLNDFGEIIDKLARERYEKGRSNNAQT